MPRPKLFDLLVFLPGIMGSILQKDGRDLWAISGRALGRAFDDLDQVADELRLSYDDPNRDLLDDGVRATGLIPGAFAVPGLARSLGYLPIVTTLTKSFELIPGSLSSDDPANFFTFPYDWRRDNRVAARRLQHLIDERLRRWRQYTGKHDAKTILIAHSMGGLVARHYLEVLGGWESCKALFTFGTPHRGSPNALKSLSSGLPGPLTRLNDALRSFHSVYQLLPIYPAVITDNGPRRVAEAASLPQIDRGRALDAIGFHRAIETAVETNRREARYHETFKTIPFVGTRQPTLQSARLVDGRVLMGHDLPDAIPQDLGDGDGTVPRVSAIPIELSAEYRETFVGERHAALPNHPGALADLVERIKQMQAPNLRSVRGPDLSATAEQAPALALHLEEYYLAGEPIDLRVTPVHMATARLQLRLEPVDIPGALPVEIEGTPQGDIWPVSLGFLAPGLYQISVRAGQVAQVSDLFEVLEERG